MLKICILVSIVSLCIINTQAWSVVSSTGDIPLNRGGGQMREIGNELILFGGYNECFDASECEHEFYNDVYHFNLFTNVWSKPTVVPDPVHGIPAPRTYYGACVHPFLDALIIYGGTSFPVQFFDFEQWNAESITYGDLWFYYPSEFRWEYKETFGAITPGVRSGAGIEVVRGRLILSSGINSNTFISVEDTWSLNLRTFTWTNKTGKFSDKVDNPLPFDLGRYIFPFMKQRGDLYALSGNVIPIPPLLGVQHQDMWKYNVRRNTWTDVLPFDSNSDFTGRVHGGGVAVGNTLVAFFGDNNDDENECVINSISSGHSPVNETWVYRLYPSHSRQWKLLSFEEQVPALKRVYYAKSDRKDAIYVYGGFTVTCNSEVEEENGFFWNNDVYKLEFDDLFQW